MLAEAVGSWAVEHRFSGVVRVDRRDRPTYVRAFGEADRALGVANTPTTRFAMASGSKGFTALVVVSLVADEILALDTTARSLLGDDLPEIEDTVTVEHLLAHRSGIGDYIDEDSDIGPNDYVMTVPVHRLLETGDYLPALAGFPQKFAPDATFSYCNSGYVVLALLTERASGRPFHRLVEDRVCRPAGMTATAYLRSDELPGGVARGYLESDGLRTNVLHLPVRGSGDGGAFTTVDDVHRLWAGFMGGRIVTRQWVSEMVTSRSSVDGDEPARYGLGVWLDPGDDGVALVGSDAGVSFYSEHVPRRELTWTVIANTTAGAWPMVAQVRTLVDPGRP